MKTKSEVNAKDIMREKGYLPVVEAAARLGYTTQTLRNWVREGTIHGVHLGKGVWVEWASVRSYFKAKDPEAAKLVGLS